MNKYQSYKSSGLEWIGEIPDNWSISKFKYLTNKEVQYGVNSSSDNYLESGIRFIRTTDILESGKLIEGGVYVEESTIPERQITELYDFLISRSGTLGRTYLHLNKDKYTYGGYLVRFNFGSESLSKFIEYYCKSTSFSSWITLNTIVSTIGNVNGQKYSNMELPLPPLKSISEIVKYLDEKTELLDELISTKERKITLLKEQRTSLINEVVTKGLNPNVKMKDSGVEWIGEIPEGWKMMRVSNFGTFFKGNGIKKDEVRDEGIPCIRYGEIYTKYDRIVYNPISFIDLETSKNSIQIKKGDILFTGSGETLVDIGKSLLYYGDENIFVGGDIIVLRLKEGFNPLYLSYLLNSSFVQYQKSLMGRGEIIVHIYSKNIKEIKTPIPSLKEQLQIVEHLDTKTKEIDDLVQKEQKKIDLLKEYRQSLISEVVTGKIKVTN